VASWRSTYAGVGMRVSATGKCPRCRCSSSRHSARGRGGRGERSWSCRFRRSSSPAAKPGFVPSFEVKETKDSYLFKADLPGVKESDLDISVTGNRLTISGERQQEKKDEGDTFYAYERSYGSFSRSFTLPEGIDVDHINGELRDGVLNVVVPKKPEVQPKRVLLKGSSESERKAKA
jgi:HSP20 family protein